MSSSPIVDRIRIIPRPDDFLDRNVGSSGEVFFNGATSSLRVYSGKDRSGFELARADLINVEDNALTSKLTALGYSTSQGGGNTSITVSDSAPTDADEGQLWFDTDSGVLFVYYGEWIQPSSAGSAGSSSGGDSYTDADAISAITSNDLDMQGNKVLFGNVYANLGDLPSATSYHGMFAHVHSTGKAYFAHAGNWVELANTSDAGGSQNVFSTISSDDGSTTANTNNDTLSIIGGTNINTAIATDSDNVTINLSSFSIDFLSDVDTSSSAPQTGNVLKWNGSQWAPGTDATVGGSGTDADTLDGFDSSYYLDYNNLSNTPSVVALDSFSVGNELTANGDGAISYDNTTGVFRYTPPDLSSYLTSVAFSDLTSTPTTLSGYGITDALVSGTTTLTDLGISDGTNGQVLATDGAGNFSFATVAGSGGGTVSGLDTQIQFNDNGSFGADADFVFITDGSGYNRLGLGISSPNTVPAGGAAGEADAAAWNTVLHIHTTQTGNAGSVVKFTRASTGSTDSDGAYIGLNNVDNLLLNNQEAGNIVLVTNSNIGLVVEDTGVVKISNAYTLPSTDGTNGQVLTTNGSGQVTFSTISSGASSFDNLTDAATANSLTIDKVYEPAMMMFRVDNDSTSAYTFPSHYSGNNPTIYVISGTTVAFDLDAIPGHPFELQDNTLTALTSGLVHVASDGTVSTDSNAQGKSSGTLYWRIPESISGNYAYECQSHASMVGSIVIKRLSTL